MDPITLGILGAIGATSLADLVLTLRKKRPQIIKQNDVKCPFCGLLITGDSDMDRKVHVVCIADAQILHAERKAEHEAERQREEEERKAEEAARKNQTGYTVKVDKLTRMAWSEYHQANCRYTWAVHKDGVLVDKGYAPDMEDAKWDTEEAIRKHKGGDVPHGDLMTTWTVKK